MTLYNRKYRKKGKNIKKKPTHDVKFYNFKFCPPSPYKKSTNFFLALVVQTSSFICISPSVTVKFQTRIQLFLLQHTDIFRNRKLEFKTTVHIKVFSFLLSFSYFLLYGVIHRLFLEQYVFFNVIFFPHVQNIKILKHFH